MSTCLTKTIHGGLAVVKYRKSILGSCSLASRITVIYFIYLDVFYKVLWQFSMCGIP